MRREIKWTDIYTDFKKTYPKLSKDVIHYEPHGHLVIAVHFRDATKQCYKERKRTTAKSSIFAKGMVYYRCHTIL